MIRYLFSKVVKKINIPSIKNSYIDKTAKVCSASHLVNVSMGKYSYVGNSCTVINARIGNYCSIADNCIIGGLGHPIDWVSTSPIFHEGKNIFGKNFSNHEYRLGKMTSIGNDVWIGSNCLIKSGLSIEDGAIIGMGSVLTKNVGAYEIWAGNPARLIKKRFADETIEKLLNSKWWDYDLIELRQKAAYFNNVEKFIQDL
ncbi:CatB-related O-acetyltransferase [Paenibacillus sp. GYB004]|uniref:CatB-related O-acetyltransferase n=1 Tax=Paenibacillus sp. GYB004 TaxID=2994393 RepID=UPI002F969093